MHHRGALHLVTAARQRDVQLLPGLDQRRIRDVVGRRDLLVGDEPGEDAAGDAVEGLAGSDLVERAVHGGAVAGGAGAGEADADGGAGGDGAGGRGGEGQAVGREQGAEGADLEEGHDGGEGGGVARGVAEERLASGCPAPGVAGELGRPSRRQQLSGGGDDDAQQEKRGCRSRHLVSSGVVLLPFSPPRRNASGVTATGAWRNRLDHELMLIRGLAKRMISLGNAL